ncbi:Lrp/AsnC family transcriptional regulator [Nakamurella leprariae]|uniref:Lrp/AsnC family transcriptional regulator n=1 Tax=Nakamurella leprariae TaxID=2803911 RepID=A0A939C3Y1_9ACTN|nr:Lrp/AsnC family transcriptional regulator [Nakamurella leprariae]MBM9469527.1 Lrp/AsnC family transcriptional regulator [Nakamurella leprariae]
MTGPPLDAADEALLGALAQDGRAGVEALARTTGLPRGTVRTRTQRLLAEVVDVLGIVHPAVFGLTEYALVRVAATGPVGPVAAAVAALDAVPFVSVTAGETALVAEVRTRTRAALAGTVARIAAAPGVLSAESSPYLEILKDASVAATPTGDDTVASGAPTEPVDALDRRLLAELQRDGRLSYSSLAEGVGLSVGATRTRVLRLLDTGVLHIGVRPRPVAAGLVQAGVAMAAHGPVEPLIEQLRRVDSVTYLATALGRWPLIATVRAESLGGLADQLDRVRSLPGAGPSTTWTHLRLVKERYQDDLA